MKWDEITLCSKGSLDHNSQNSTISDIVSDVGRFPVNLCCCVSDAANHPIPPTVLQRPPMRSLDELVELSPESFPWRV